MSSSTIARRALCGLGLLTLAPGAALARDATPPKSSDALRYVDAKRRLMVQALVNDQGPFAFMIDTGASSSVMSSELVDRLGLVRQGQTQLHGIAGVQTVDTVAVDSLSVGKRARRKMTLSVLPAANLGMAGILGLDWLGDNSLMLDYGARRMHVGALPLPDDRTITVKAHTRRSGLTLIQAHMPGQALMAFIDSGSTTTVGNLALLAAARARDQIIGDVIDLELRSVTGQTLPGRIAVLKSLTLGKMILRRVPLVVGPVHTFDYWGMRDDPAILIGSDILQLFDHVALDFRRGEVRFRVAERQGRLPASRL